MNEYYKNNVITLYCGDCIEIIPHLQEKIDCVIVDPPYGTLNASNKEKIWDNTINFENMWKVLYDKVENNSAIVLFGQGIFSARMVMSNYRNFKYDIIWNKNRVSGFLNAKKMPLRQHEIINVFAKGKINYHSQMIKCDPRKSNHCKVGVSYRDTNRCYGTMHNVDPVITNERYPTSILNISKGNDVKLHPTQKPVKLIEWLIKSYSNEGDTILDFCAGSGTTAIACMNTGRKCVLIEKEEKYCEISKNMIIKALK